MKRIVAAFALFACTFFVQAYDIVATVSIEGNTKWYFDIELANNDIDFTAFQLDITLDSEDAEMKQTNMLRRWLMVNHNIRLTRLDGHYRVLGYSLSNEVFKTQEGMLFSFELDGDIKGITINKIIFAKPDGTEVEADVYNRPLDRDNDDAISNVTASQKENKVIYNMEGKQVYRIDRRGIYIQNGKKIAVK